MHPAVTRVPSPERRPESVSGCACAQLVLIDQPGQNPQSPRRAQIAANLGPRAPGLAHRRSGRRGRVAPIRLSALLENRATNALALPASFSKSLATGTVN